MAHETLQAIVGTAVVDSGFRRSLLEKSANVLDSFELTPEESEVLGEIQADTFQGFVRQLHSWISRDSAAGLPGTSY